MFAEGGPNPAVRAVPGEDDTVAAVDQRIGELGVAFQGPASKRILPGDVARAAGCYGDERTAVGVESAYPAS